MTTTKIEIKVDIPRNYLGFESGLSYEFKSAITVLTGLNGNGKSRLLQWVLNSHKDKKSIFSKSPFNDFLTNRDINKTPRVRDGRDEKQLRDVEGIIIELEDFCNKFLRNKLGYPPPTVTFWEDVLFHKEKDESKYRDQLLREEGSSRFRSSLRFFDIIINATGADEAEVMNEFGIITYTQTINAIAISLIDQRAGSTIKRKGTSGNKGKISDMEKAIHVLLSGKKLSSISEDKKSKKIEFSDTEQKKIVESINSIDKIKATEDKAELKNKITSRLKLEEFIHRKLNPMGDSIDALIEKLEAQIQKDHNGKSKDSSRTLLTINERLENNEGIGQFFKFKIKEPTDHSTYRLRFQYKDKVNLSEVMFRDLSTGEKVLFELVAIGESLKANNQLNIKLILLDEFDANLNPSLVIQYLDEIRKLAKQGIQIILTTHNPSTVAAINSKKDGDITENICWIEKGEIKSVNDEDITKHSIMKNLAPRFIFEDNLPAIINTCFSQYDVVIFTEGDYDVSHLKKALEKRISNKRYGFFSSGGCGNIEKYNTFVCILNQMKNEPLNNVSFIYLFYFDTEGIQKANELINKENSTEMTKWSKLQTDKSDMFVEIKNNHFVMCLTPDENSPFWETKNFEIESVYTQSVANKNLLSPLEDTPLSYFKKIDTNKTTCFLKNPEDFEVPNNKKKVFSTYCEKSQLDTSCFDHTFSIFEKISNKP